MGECSTQGRNTETKDNTCGRDMRPSTMEGKECVWMCVCVSVLGGGLHGIRVRGGGYMCKFETITLVKPGVLHTFKAERC